MTANLLAIKEILDAHGIRFWLFGGTFLGAIRNRGFIVYDNDSDLAIYHEDLPRLIGCEGDFVKAGFQTAKNDEFYMCIKDGEHTDIFYLHQEARRWRKVYIDAQDCETYCDVDFLGTKWRVFNNPQKWLSYMYGFDWQVPYEERGLGEGVPFGKK